jgi:hypothetical protein
MLYLRALCVSQMTTSPLSSSPTMSLAGHDESLVNNCFEHKRQQNAIEGLPNSATASWINALPSRPRLARRMRRGLPSAENRACGQEGDFLGEGNPVVGCRHCIQRCDNNPSGVLLSLCPNNFQFSHSYETLRAWKHISIRVYLSLFLLLPLILLN